MQNFNQFKPKKHTLDIPSMPQNEKKYTYLGKIFSKFHKNITQKRLFKPLAAGTLALFMGIGTLCGVLLAPNSAQATISSPKNTTTNLTAEEKLLTGQELGLVPENDPVIFTTESGLDIKFHGAILSNGALNGYAYVTMANKNWIIIGKSTSGLSTFSKWSFYQKIVTPSSSSPHFETSTVAGKAIWGDNTMNDIIQGSFTVPGSLAGTSVTANSEIPSGCVLVLSEKLLAYCSAGVNSYACPYNTSSPLYKTIEPYCKNTSGTMSSTIGFTAAEMALIQPQTLTSAYIANTSSNPDNYPYYEPKKVTLTGQYLFPLAYAGVTNANSSVGVDAHVPYFNAQNFCIENYLKTAATRLRSDYVVDREMKAYWLRSGAWATARVCAINYEGNFDSPGYSSWCGIRPAFVLKLT